MERKKMLKSLFFVFVTLALVTAGFSKDEPVDSQWAAAAASIDGMNTEWGNVPMNSQKKTKVDYAFMNSEQDLFVLFIFKNPQYLSSINWTGMTVWFSSQGKKDKDLGIRFINKQISADEYIALAEKQAGRTLADSEKEKIRQNKAYMFFEQELINKKAEGYSEDAPRPKFKGAGFRTNNLEKAVIYEFAISLSTLAEIVPELGAEPGKTLNLNFEWGGASKEYKEALASGLAQQDMSGRADRATGSLTSERGANEGLGSLESDRSDLARMRGQLQKIKKYDFWVELSLAQNE